jgi:hypothetical protein
MSLAMNIQNHPIKVSQFVFALNLLVSKLMNILVSFEFFRVDPSLLVIWIDYVMVGFVYNILLLSGSERLEVSKDYLAEPPCHPRAVSAGFIPEMPGC